MNNCSTCHWWTKSFGDKDGRSVCVWHSGTKDVENRKIDFGGSKPLRTAADFGCVCWSVDERKPDEQSIIEQAKANINMWKAQGKTREELLREFGQMLDFEGKTQ